MYCIVLYGTTAQPTGVSTCHFLRAYTIINYYCLARYPYKNNTFFFLTVDGHTHAHGSRRWRTPQKYIQILCAIYTCIANIHRVVPSPGLKNISLFESESGRAAPELAAGRPPSPKSKSKSTAHKHTRALSLLSQGLEGNRFTAQDHVGGEFPTKRKSRSRRDDAQLSSRLRR